MFDDCDCDDHDFWGNNCDCGCDNDCSCHDDYGAYLAYYDTLDEDIAKQNGIEKPYLGASKYNSNLSYSNDVNTDSYKSIPSDFFAQPHIKSKNNTKRLNKGKEIAMNILAILYLGLIIYFVIFGIGAMHNWWW